ncbi:MarR family transcriptional regulator [Devosia sp.]|uniref:MarR family winged helix-turn-helix transcriptional regulator n=1 Tax=Devosia sp. TaxID=1871048 RepID=UPI0032630990
MSSDKQTLIGELGTAIMRWQDQTQKFDELVGHIYGLGPSERLCLSFLVQGPQTASAIAREIRLTPAAVTTLLDRLEQRGYVRRRPDPTDRRKVMVKSAAAALELVEAVYAPLAIAGAAMLDRYDVAELNIVSRVIRDSMEIQEKAARELAERGEPRSR